MRNLDAYRLGLIVCALASVAGCTASGPAAGRAESPGARPAQPAAYYEVPPRAPRGDVRVTALGVATLEPPGDDEDRVRAVHVRLLVSNGGDETAWQVDTREQTASVDGWGQSRPAFASASIGRPPLVTVVPAGSAAIDLYYPLPAEIRDDAELPRVDLLWHVHTRGGTVSDRTSFRRVPVEPPPAQLIAAAWLGAGWCDPLWPDYAFAGAPVLPAAYYDQPLLRVASPPR